MTSSTPNDEAPSPVGTPGAGTGAWKEASPADAPGAGRWIERAAWVLGGALVLLGVWAFLAGRQEEYMLPSPEETLRALVTLAGTPEFWQALVLTLRRALTGLVLAVAAGVVWGCAMGRWERLSWFCQVGLQVLLSTPAIIFVILGLLWFGNNGGAVIFVVALVTAPVLTTATAQAVRSIDTDLLEMARLFRLSRWTTLRRVGFPMVAPPVLAAATVALGQSVRVSVMAELLATASGMGGAIRSAQLNIDSSKIFAYAVVMTVLTFTLEAVFVAPLRRRMHAHRESASG
ncbi:MAG: ABC transporter permease [Actinomycetaceae bacterium]|nr:ABC transporter permease [Actinomycetaceae bacterium]